MMISCLSPTPTTEQRQQGHILSFKKNKRGLPIKQQHYADISNYHHYYHNKHRVKVLEHEISAMPKQIRLDGPDDEAQGTKQILAKIAGKRDEVARIQNRGLDG